MKRQCMKCEYAYNPTKEYINTRMNFQSCGYGLVDGGSPVGEYCPKTDKRLLNINSNQK